jgi:O-antigen/teichoic acid export membrane protein
VAVPFLVASLSYRGLLTVDRYALEYLAGLEAVGIYSFYANFRNAILSFVEMGILFVYRPRVVAAWQADPGGRPSELLARMARLLVAAPVLLALLAAAAVPLVLDFVGETAYRGHQAVLWILLAAAAAASIAEIPHTVLYARHRDRALISSNLLALALAVPLHVVLILRWDLVGAAAASFGSFAILAALKAGLLRGDRR